MIWRWLTLTATALVLLVGATLLGAHHGDFTSWTHLAMGTAVVGSLLVLGTIRLWHKAVIPQWGLWTMIALGLVMRVLLLPAPYELSDDAARYHWDGKVVSHHINPYRYPPRAPELAHLRTSPRDHHVNHPDTRTCYPPAAQAVFAAAYRLTPTSLRGLQGLGLLAELFTWWILARELARRKRSQAWLLLAVWSPLLVFQGYLPGHIDLFTLPFIALLIVASEARHARRAGLWLAVACLFKPLALLLVPAVSRQLGRRRTGIMVATSTAVVVTAYLPFLSAGRHLFSSVFLMATDWSFNGSVGNLLEHLLPQNSAHAVATLGIGAAALTAACRREDLVSRALGAQLAFVVFTPTLFPWYLMGTIPLLVLGTEPALLALLVVVPLADAVIIPHQLAGIWHEATWVRLVEYTAFYGVWGWCWCRRKRRGND